MPRKGERQSAWLEGGGETSTADAAEGLLEAPDGQKSQGEGLNQSRDVTTRLQKRLQEIEARHRTSMPTPQPESIEQGQNTVSVPMTTRGSRARRRSPVSLIQQAQLTLFELEQQGRFTNQPIVPESEYPTFLTRLPLFPPGRRSNQRHLLDQDNALRFSTPWGDGRRHGPPLTVYDEDTLIAIGRLRQNLLVGRPHHLPVPVSEIYRGQGENTVHVHVVQCMLSDIQSVCGTSQGGKNNRLRLDSVKRLAATVIEFSTRTAGKFIGRGTDIKLIDVAWQEYEDNAILYLQFSPVMARWFEREYTFIDWNLRRKLIDTGKALHRFLSGQPKNYEIYTRKLLTTIGYLREYKKFMADLRIALEQLAAEGWITEYRIVGDGRKVPHKLVTKRR